MRLMRERASAPFAVSNEIAQNGIGIERAALGFVEFLCCLAARFRALCASTLEIERHCSADELLQGRLIDLLAFVDVNGAPDIAVKTRVE